MANKRSRVRLSPKDYKRLCYDIHERDKWRCIVCRYRQDLHAHHIVFRSQGGPDASYNLLTVCTNCHEAIHSRYVIIMPLVEGHLINADEGVKQLWVNGWKPKRKVT
jgi:5-methylcytosine-specific restriction endonuclease McrA